MTHEPHVYRALCSGKLCAHPQRQFVFFLQNLFDFVEGLAAKVWFAVLASVFLNQPVDVPNTRILQTLADRTEFQIFLRDGTDARSNPLLALHLPTQTVLHFHRS